MCYGGSTYERLLSESSRSCMLAFRKYAIFFSVEIAQGLFELK
jgi:hypothetical protein